MYSRSPVDVKYPCHIWLWEVPSTAKCHHLESHESACAWPQTQELHHLQHLLVHSEKVSIYNPQVHQLSHLSSSWSLPAHRLLHREISLQSGYFPVSQGIFQHHFVYRISGLPVIHGSMPFLCKDGEKVVDVIWWNLAALLPGWELMLEESKFSHLIWCFPIIDGQGHIYWGLNNNPRTRSRSWWHRHCECS